MPRLRWRLPRPEHVLRNRRLRDRQPELQQLAGDPWRTPEGIGVAHRRIRSRSSVLIGADPIGADSSMPSSVEIPVHAIGRPSPAAPRAANAATSSAPSIGKPRTVGPSLSTAGRLAGLPYGELLPKREVLQRQLAVRSKAASQCPK